MCGILGFTGRNDPALVRQWLQKIEHRGRDESIAFSALKVNLGMNRLAIQDLTKGYYPFKYKKYYLVFNGELYNYPALKKELIGQGEKFKTHCDAEVILPLFHRHGFKAFNLLEGMFTICIFDAEKKVLTLARDKSGEKPLYYAQDPSNHNVSFASELKCLLPTNTASINKAALTGYLFHGSTNHGQTLLNGIKKLPAAHYLTFPLSTKKITLKPYWRAQPQSQPSGSESDLIKELDEIMEEAVTSRLIADVEVGAFLSGGIDSSLVTFYAQRHKKHLHTFSISFPNAGRHDESDFAQTIAQQLHTTHHEIKFSSKHVREILPQLGYLIDEPIVDPAFMPTYFLAQAARKKVKVVLTGEGADEIFGGYYRYYKYLGLQRFQNLTQHLQWLKPLRDKVAPHRLNSLFAKELIYSPQSVWQEHEITHLLRGKSATVQGKLPSNNTLLAMQLFDYGWYLPEQLLMKVDKATMANNLESRAPFLDSRVIQFGFSLPQHHKLRGIHNKYLLRKLFARHISPNLAWRKKHGFSLPLAQWFRTELRDLVYDVQKEFHTYQKIFEVGYVDHIIDEHMSGSTDHANKIWSIVTLTQWLKQNDLELS